MDEKYQFRLKLLSFLEEQTDRYISRETIEKYLKVSKSKLKYTFLCLEEDLKEFGNFKVLIEASAQKVDTLHVTAALIDNLRLFYAKKSGMFLLFDAIVVSDISSSEFEKRYFFSRTKVFNLRKKLESLLNEVGITLEMQKLIGEEKAIRKFIFEVYYYYFNGLEFPFPSNVKINVEKTKNSLISIFECDHRPTKMKQLELFIGVCFLRIKWQYFLTESVLNLELFDSFQYKSMRDHILKQVTFPIENRSNTVDFELDFYWLL
ncbi:helix-turn-helix domain-containing protein [Enterococcus rivorum]|uniref:helix-turn-helix domain-containing protein n=1 Tax=Enterococcus rivorum TaxID=762845 RepID=UPI00362B3525